MDIERSLITRVILDSSLTAALDTGLEPLLFEGDARAVWVWMVSHYQEHGVTPGEQALRQAFPEFTAATVTETLSYYVAQLRRKYAYNAARESMSRAGNRLRGQGDPFEAVEDLRRAVVAVDDLANASQDADWTEGGEARLEAYNARKESGGVTGITTPFEALDAHTGGWQDGEFIIFAAKSGTGKTWMECIMAHHSWTEGVPQILFSTEMSRAQIELRLDAIQFQLPFSDLRRGTLTEEQEQAWREGLGALAESERFPIVDQENPTMGLLSAKIERYCPRVVYLDAAYTMTINAPSRWERMATLSAGLKSLARGRDIPIVTTFQLTEDGDNLADFKGIKRDADVVIFMEQTEDERLAGIMRLRIVKQRQGDRGEVILIWDLDRMVFGVEEEREEVNVSQLEEQPLRF